ncbi:MAG: CBS domain-containing protein [Candidatus Liberibacter ctenarytainae]|uniref:CBS domain-containing protein n=1 Tax=Candidatus Liberibacter ctenarytainae TaxID=2020335 RepID=A0A937AEW8_9HYPH|nr:CBS domain-containing protein [Candidatus Liberibacter ctenarytainae]
MSDLKINSSGHPKEKSRDVDSSDSISRISFASPYWKFILRILRKIWKSIMKRKDSDAEWENFSLDGILSPQEKEIFRNILLFRKVRVDDIMIPRVSIDAVEDKATIYEVMMMFEKYGRSWMPVYRGSLDNPRGIVHMRDLLAHISRISVYGKDTNWDISLAESNIIKDILFVPSSMLASDLLKRIQESRVHMALVIDEHGGTDGLVSHEDIVADLTGYMKSEYSNNKEIISIVSEDTFIVDARADLEELAKVMRVDSDIFKGGQDVDSLGGLIFSVLDRIPSRDEVVREIPGFEIFILDADVRCVRRVRMRRLVPASY